MESNEDIILRRIYCKIESKEPVNFDVKMGPPVWMVVLDPFDGANESSLPLISRLYIFRRGRIVASYRILGVEGSDEEKAGSPPLVSRW